MESPQQRAVSEATRTAQGRGGTGRAEGQREAATPGRPELRKGEGAAMVPRVPQEEAGPCGLTEARRGGQEWGGAPSALWMAAERLR